MIAIVFLYSLAAIFIFGAELNAAIESRRRARNANADHDANERSRD